MAPIERLLEAVVRVDRAGLQPLRFRVRLGQFVYCAPAAASPPDR